ncbi:MULTISPECIES: MFS transporter [unclassified Streptomyces]|uniref:MFS transporter n=1 Tax=unclassified Streptomyces TaxID=2593676 RepID=UPI002E81D2AD|nr:MFS transporter [Streptomyces sp. NBC_00589]WTI38305.1 MFS transporter [Streptomyces sp. NBC_00775]WUB28016.1 MFS transporter [Streptomyces sp. NBC_00589]
MRLRLLLLALGTFAVGTDGMVMAGILPLIARDLNVSITVAGQLVTVFALSYAALAPVLATATARWPRHRALLSALAVFSVANALTALAPSYGVLLATRVLAAVGAALYTPTANAVATSLVPPERRGRAIAVVMGGLTAATALGVPLGTWIGRTDWRLTMWLVTALGLAAFAGLALMLRELPQPVGGLSLRERLTPLANPRVLGAALTTFLVFLAFQTTYIYYTVATYPATGGDQDRLTLLLLVSGFASVGGGQLGGRLVDRWGARPVILASGTAYLALATASPWTLQSLPTALASAALTPLVGWSIAVALTARLASLDPANAPLLISLNSSALYLGIAAAGGTGSLAISLFGDRWFLLAGAGLAALAVAVAAFTTREARPARTPAKPAPVRA